MENNIKNKNQIPKKTEDLSKWYNTVIFKAELCDYGPSKGTMIFRPYGFAIWENVQSAMNKYIKEAGVENAYFPLFIPESFLNKEKEHVKGFSPELAVVTIGGGEVLEEKLIVRPTSETIMYDAYSRWVTSYRDLPLLINQWNNVVRWEKRSYMFLRTTEFLWQEGHTVHATHQEAIEFQKWAMQMYSKIYREEYALDGYVGYKSSSEKFAGALNTLTFESLMPDGKALQSCTSHDLGQNFSTVFNIKFQDKDGTDKFGWQTSWGFSTRSLGGMFMAHGDNDGLIMPPKLAPIQVIVIPTKPENEYLSKYSKDIFKKLKDADIRVRLDDRDTNSFGYKINKYEVKGVPIRIEVGEIELNENTVTLVNRKTKVKTKCNIDELEAKVKTMLKEIQEDLFNQNKLFLKENTFDASTYDEFKSIMKTTKGFIKAFWCEDETCETKIKEETKATTRCLPIDSKEETGACIYCNKTAKFKWLFAQAY